MKSLVKYQTYTNVECSSIYGVRKMYDMFDMAELTNCLETDVAVGN